MDRHSFRRSSLCGPPLLPDLLFHRSLSLSTSSIWSIKVTICSDKSFVGVLDHPRTNQPTNNSSILNNFHDTLTFPLSLPLSAHSHCRLCPRNSTLKELIYTYVRSCHGKKWKEHKMRYCRWRRIWQDMYAYFIHNQFVPRGISPNNVSSVHTCTTDTHTHALII